MAHDAPLDRDADRSCDEERGRNGDDDRETDVIRHQELNDVGGVSTEHHQFAVRHVDDAHDAEGDGETDRDQHEDGTLAQAVNQRLHARIEAPVAFDDAQALLCGLANGGVRFPVGSIAPVTPIAQWLHHGR